VVVGFLLAVYLYAVSRAARAARPAAAATAAPSENP